MYGRCQFLNVGAILPLVPVDFVVVGQESKEEEDKGSGKRGEKRRRGVSVRKRKKRGAGGSLCIYACIDVGLCC